jgi:hypothetical protein
MPPRLIKLCLIGLKHGHYDNAEIGSLLNNSRKPNNYDRAQHYCLNFLHV